jgi:hypothetical protein
MSLCRVLTVTSPRLGALLERYIGLPLADRLAVCPNGAEFPAAGRAPEPPRGLIFTSSDALALTTAAGEFVDAVAAFTRRHRLPVYCCGQPLARLSAAWPTMIYLGLVPYWHYHALLATLPPMLGVAPLETAADPETLDFINGKSDIKLAEFAGHGHPGVYSLAPPYADTDLAAGRLVANRRDAWEEGLEFMLREGWRRLADEQAAVKEKRHMDRLARECWLPALTRVRLPAPLSGRDLKAGLGRLRRAANTLRHILYTQDSHTMKRVQARLPAWLLKLARRWY